MTFIITTSTPQHIVVLFSVFCTLSLAVLIYYVCKKDASIFACSVIFGSAVAVVLILPPRFGLTPFFLLAILALILVAIDIRVGYKRHLGLQFVHTILLVMTLFYVAIFLIMTFGTFSGRLNILVVSVKEFSNNDYYLMFNAINKYKWPSSKIIWDQVYCLHAGKLHTVNPEAIQGITNYVENLLRDTLVKWEAGSFSTPAPIKPNSDIYNRLQSSHVLFTTKLHPFVSETEALHSFANEVITRFNTTHVHFQNIWDFLRSKSSMENLYMSLPLEQEKNVLSNLTVGSSKLMAPKQLVQISPYVAHLLQAAVNYQATGVLSLSDFFGLLDLFANSMDTSNFTYGAALYQFIGKINVHLIFWLLLAIMYLLSKLYAKLSDILPASSVGEPLRDDAPDEENDNDDPPK